MPEVLDYRKDKLYINGLAVGPLTMNGFLAERVPNIGRQKQLGSSGVSQGDLPDFLEVSLDGLRRPRKVCCYTEDRTLAVLYIGFPLFIWTLYMGSYIGPYI